jgi:hypothetical protein
MLLGYFLVRRLPGFFPQISVLSPGINVSANVRTNSIARVIVDGSLPEQGH